MKRFLTGLTIAAAASPLLGCTAGAEKGHDIDAARQAMAARYASCAIAEVVDTHTPPPSNFGQIDTPRDTVTISLRLANTTAAQQVQQEYKEDNKVTWYPSVGHAGGITQNNQGEWVLDGSEAARDPNDDFGSASNANPTFQVHFRRDHPLEKREAVFVTTEAQTSGPTGLTRTTATTYCGGLIFHGSPDGPPQWIQDPKPPVIANQLVTTVIPR